MSAIPVNPSQASQPGWQEKADEIIDALQGISKLFDELLGPEPAVETATKGEEINSHADALSAKMQCVWDLVLDCRQRLQQLQERF